jgi:hypothetical protein
LNTDSCPSKKIIGAVADDVVALDQRQRVVRRQPYRVLDDRDQRVDRARTRRSRSDLCPADVGRGVGNLTLQVGQLDHVIIDDPQRANARRGQIQQQGTTEATGADHQHPGIAQAALPDTADLLQQDVAGVAADFGFVEYKAHGTDIGRRAGQTKSGLPCAARSRSR